MVDVANIHLPVLLDDCVNLMAPALEHENAIAVDCTLGLAGHSIAFLKAAPQARLIGIDRDSEALGLATERMEREGLADRFIPVHAAFDQLDQVLADQDIERVDAVFMDLGLSSLQIDETDRGFSYSHDAPLDMRMDVSQPLTAERILATYDAAELVRIFKEYGEERFSRQIARASWRVETRSRLPPPHSSTVWSMKWCRKPTARRAIPPNASSRRCALKSTANWTSSPPHCRRPRTDCMSGDDWWWSPIIRSKTKPSNRSWHKGCEWMFRLACLSYRRMPNRFSRISREVPSRPTNMKSQPTRDRLRCGCGRWKSAVRFRHDGGNALRKPRRA